MERLKGRRILVTGSSRGIGKALALAFAREGADVGVNYNASESRASEVVNEIKAMGRSAQAFKANLGDYDECVSLIDLFVHAFGGIDVLVNNAAICFLDDFLNTPQDRYDLVMNVNLKAAFFCGQSAAHHMIKQGGGKIINVSSLNGELSESHQCAYNVSKGGLNMLTRSMAQELVKHNILVNAIAPGIVLTEAAVEDLSDPAVAQEYLTNIPIGRFAVCEDVVGAAVFLAGDESNYFVGQILTMDGGISIQQMRDLH